MPAGPASRLALIANVKVLTGIVGAFNFWLKTVAVRGGCVVIHVEAEAQSSIRDLTRVAVSVLVVHIGSSTRITWAAVMSPTNSEPTTGSTYVF